MSQLDDHGRPEPPIAADETATLLGFLDYQRATLAWKCAGLDTASLRATLAPRRSPWAGCSSTWPTSKPTGSPGGCTGETGNPRGTRWTVRSTPTGTGT